MVPGSLDDAGYRAAYAVAEDNLRLGHDVIGDSVNPWMLTRDAWRAVGVRAGARVVEVETVCSDEEEHRRRVEARENEVPGLILPDWQAVIGRDYHAWDRDHVTVDTAKRSVATCVELILAAIRTLNVDRRERRPAADQVGGLFGDHDHRRVDVAADEVRDHRGIDDA
jgi:hypothetical protein